MQALCDKGSGWILFLSQQDVANNFFASPPKILVDGACALRSNNFFVLG